MKMMPQRLRHRLPLPPLVYLFIYIFISLKSCHASDSIDGRFSFSLTTFDSAGKLRQVQYATQAASLGTPVVAVCLKDEILMACPQVLPSPFMKDDGTARFNRITSNIAVAHSGLSADGRVVVAAAQKMAVEHAYTFDEPIPIESFLEGVALLFQEYTMKPASRPFGCTLLVACVPADDEVATPRLYRIDPSGSVETMDTYAIIGSLQNKSSLAEALETLVKESPKDDKPKADLTAILEDSLGKIIPATSEEKPRVIEPGRNYLIASLSRNRGLQVRRERQPTQ